MSKRFLIFIAVATVGALVLVFKTFAPHPTLQQPIPENQENVHPLDLKMVASIPLSGGSSRFDYQSIDLQNNRLFISHMGANIVSVVDIKNQSVLHDISGIASPTGVLFVPELNKVYVSASGANQVISIDASTSTLPIVRRISVGNFPDGIADDPHSHRVFVSNESGKQVSVIDGEMDKPVETIDIGGEVGNTHYDSVSKRIYSTDQTNNQLIAINPQTLAVEGRIPIADCRGAHGFYLDAATHYALITCEDSSTFVAIDLNTQQVVTHDTVGSTPDVVAFDTLLRRLYVSSEGGVLSVFDVQQGSVKKTMEGFIGKDAHSVSVDSRTHKVYIPFTSVNGKPTLEVFEPLSVISARNSTKAGADIEDDAGIEVAAGLLATAFSQTNPSGLSALMQDDAILVQPNGELDPKVRTKEALLQWLSNHWSQPR